MNGSQDQEEESELAPRTDQTTTESSTAKRLLRLAAEYWSVPTSVSGVVKSVKSWLSSPSPGEGASDTEMVARILHRLLQTYERRAGEEFEGRPQQYEQLYAMAKSVLGSSVSKRVLKSLVRAYLHI